MPTTLPMIRAVAGRIYNKSEREIQSAAVGPAAPANGDRDEENQDAFHSSGRGGGFQPPMSPQIDRSVAAIEAGPAVDTVKEQQASIFIFLKIATFLSALYMAADPWLYLYYQGDGYNMCPQMVLCTSNLTEMILLTGSRLSAGVLFSSLTISIFSKCYATRSLLHNSWFGTVVDFEPSHDIHTYFGYLTLMAAFEHAILHCARFTYGRQAYIIYETDTGRSGVIGCLLLLPIVLPMKLKYFKTKLSFQFRKSLHMLFLPLMVALCFHSVVFRYVGAILIVWYTLDRVYFTTKQTFLIDHPLFEAVGRGTMVTLDLPTGYTFKAGSYIYVSSPMISRHEWHPFSIIQLPGAVPRATFYAEAVGDWTQDLFRLGLEQPRLPLWITAAQPSLMEKSIYYNKVVLVCTGAGITPAVSIIERFSKRKTIHLLWMTRDGGMVALFEKQLRQVKSTVHLTGRPSAETKDALRRLLKPTEAKVHAASPKMSFRSMVANGAFFSARPSPTAMAADFRDDAGAQVPTARDDDSDLDTPPATPGGLPERIHRSPTPPRRQRRQTSSSVERADPIKLEFGRPDIAAYLLEAFVTGAGMSSNQPECPLLVAARVQLEASLSTRSADGAGRPLVRQTSARLDPDQKASKKNLMKVDESVVEACRQQRERRGLTQRVATSPSDTMATHSCPHPWLVLYCGANPKVEEAIAKTCDERCVNWQKEYFGAW